MKNQVLRKFALEKHADFLVLAASWFVFALLFRSDETNPGLLQTWVLLASVLSIIILDAMGYFDRHIPKPDLTSIVSLFLAMPLSAFIAKWMLMLSSHIPPMRYSQAFRASIGVAIVFELSQLAIFRLHRLRGWKWSLVTHLLPQEVESLRSEIEQSGASWWVQIRPYEPSNTNGGRMRRDETLVISRRSAHDLNHCTDLLEAHLQGQRIVDVRQLLKEFGGRVSLHNSDGWSFLLGSTYQSFPIRFYFHLKGMLEAPLAFILLILLSPLLAALSVVLYFWHGYPILYRQKRLGYRGKEFSVYKFRTMRQSAEAEGPQWAKEDDPRVEPLGRWLRKTRLDELPQLINVIRGELSFVGPRPERPEFYQVLSQEIPLFPTRLMVRPGITGWAQVRQGYAGSVKECRTKLEYDLYYVQHMSPRLDVSVVLQTAALMMRGKSGR